MKKIFIAAVLSCIVSLVNAQTFKTSMYIAKESNFETKIYQTDIIITPTTITIKKFTNGFVDDQVMKIDRTEKKKYEGKDCTWYFCTDVKKDVLSGTFYKDICIYDKAEKSLIYVSFADEVTEFWYKFYLK